MKRSLIKYTATLAVSLSLPFLSTSSLANNISFESMSQDISYLASDQLKGRASFSEDIDVAAQYISQRFDEIGLVPLAGNKNFKQTFSITSIMPKELAVSLNGQAISAKNLGMASTLEQIDWQNTQEFTTHVIGKDDNMRQVLAQINQSGGKHVALINPAHSKLFNGYRRYFAQGLNKLSLDHQGAIVMVLTEQTSINTIKVNASTAITKQTLTNVVGVLPGKEKKQEIVLYSAHYDHLGTAPTGEDNTDVIYNGADDDASGTTAIINLAQYFANKADNARTLMFSAFTAEEIGGFGSRYFSKQLNPDDVVAMINIEMIGKPSKFGAGNVWMTGMDRSNLGQLLNENLKMKNTQIYADPYPKQNLFYRSDNATLARLGVPAHSFSSTQLDKDQHYHQTSDDLASLDLQSMHQVIESLSIATHGLVDGSITPTRVDVNKIKGHGKIY
ncbi:M20/M25/M40 family metallo-hydrolase [Thalassotalea sp. G2M2-11]|uniref:M28 family peptidase n=1 Tax=Thalassotalea sp. G2M2-11 TaxID=2787627 RepID=UPI0019D146D0|nr:M20/M25/M40 family metallo-hydrolase [Thalassotalea sp. G2M2-11]